MDWSGVDYCDVWTLILTAPIHCSASVAETQLILILDEGEHIFRKLSFY